MSTNEQTPNPQTPQPQNPSTQNPNTATQELITQDEFYDELLYAIDAAKPPSIWKERFFFMTVGTLAGIGVGVVLILFAIK